MYKLLYLLIIVCFNTSHALDCVGTNLFCKIKKLRPSITTEQAIEVSALIYKYAKKHNGDANLAVAIAMQETSLRDRSREQRVIKFTKECGLSGCKETWQVVDGVTDVCMFQFHVNTIIYHKIDPIKLKNSLSYCIDWHFRLMNIKKKACNHLGDESWSCYHNKKEKLRKRYIELVERYL